MSHKKEQNLTICNTRDVKGVMLSEISQREKDKHYDFFSMWILKKKQQKT